MQKRSGLKDAYLGVLLAFAFTIFRRTLVKARVDVDKSASHHLSQNDIASDKPCSRHLFWRRRAYSIPLTLQGFWDQRQL
jgi:hypothetical protein